MIGEIEAREIALQQSRLAEAQAIQDFNQREELYGSADFANRQAMDAVRAFRSVNVRVR